MDRWLPWIALIVVVVGAANFLWFLAESAALGGDGLNGYIRDGRYFVMSHDKATEVSQAAWEWSRTHSGITIGLHLLAMAGGAYLLFRAFIGDRHRW